jgi:hypothetical protein
MPSNSLIAHGGSAPEGYDVGTTSTLVAAAQPLRKYWACTNSSDTAIYLALSNNGAEVGKGIYLAPNGGSFELNNVNMYFDKIYAIHEGSGTKRLCVQAGR